MRSNLKKYIFLILPVFFCLLTGCTKKDIDAASPTIFDTDRSYNFIFVCPIMENEYWEECMEGIRKADSEFGTSTVIIGPKTADNFAVEIIGYMEEAVNAKPDGIMVYAGIEALEPLIEQAVSQGIPVLALDSDAPDTSRIAYVGSDDYSLGYRAGEVMIELSGGNAKIGVLVSSLSAEREKRVIAAFSDAVSDYGIEIISIKETDADPDTAAKKTKEMLAEHPEITAMFNTAGYNVTGAARAKKELGRDGLILVGYDDTEENLQFVREGIINAIFAQKVEQMGYQSVSLMKEYIDKGSLPKESYDTGTTLVTRENAYSYSDAELTSDKAGKKVTVGYYNGDSAFQDGFGDNARKSGYAYEYYQAVATVTGWEYEYVYGSRTDILNMLLNGDIDIVAGIYKTDLREEQVLFSEQDMGMEGAGRYFAVNKNRPDLLSDLDYAARHILQYSPDFLMSLWQKYYGKSSTQQMLTDREREWLSNKGLLRIGYVRYNLPFSDQDADGQPTGVIKELLELLGNYLQVTMSPVCYENISAMEAALSAGEIDAAFPIYSDLWLNETKGFRQTDSFISDRVMIVYRGNYSDDLLNKVALSMTGIGQKYYLDAYYPDSEAVFYETREAVFDAISLGKERCIIGCSSILQRFLAEHSEYRDMNIAYLDTSENFCMAVNNDNSMLTLILNKAIRQLDNATITNAMISYSDVEMQLTLMDFVRQYAFLFIGILFVFFAVLLLIFISYRHKTHLFNVHQAQTQAALEEALSAANTANQAKTTFLSGMSHDIRTPMNAIVGMTTIAAKHLDDKDRVAGCLEKISLSSHHLLTLINDVLDISKIESGKLALNPVMFSLRDTVTSLVNIIRPQLQAKDLQFDVHLHGMDYETIYADEVRVNQIFINILTNAVKYTPNGGKVIMDLAEELLPDGETVRLKYIIKDTGIGMSEDFMENMYDTFARAEDSRISKIQGTGLGLAIVKQMVDIMKGTIDCKSSENEGTTFTVTLDLPIGDKDIEKPSLPPVSVLLVDDDEIFLESAGEALSDIGVTAETANSGADALKLVKERHLKGEDFPVSIVDWKMPDMDGLETIKAIREIMGSDAPIILVSAYDWNDIEDKAKDCGASGFISKPLFKSCIYEKLNQILNKPDKANTGETAYENDLKGRHLLVAEDNELNWEVIHELLNMYEISSDWALNGQICVDMLTAAAPGTYDLILMDIQMPVMNGREASRTIRKDGRDYIKNIPIIAMTADAFAEDIAASMAAGMDGHVSKPVDMAVLLQEMKKVLSR